MKQFLKGNAGLVTILFLFSTASFLWSTKRPLVAQSTANPVIADGGFEAEGVWNEADDLGCLPVIGDWEDKTGVAAKEGNQYYWAGGACSANGQTRATSNSVSQEITIPGSGGSLSFWYYALRSDPDSLQPDDFGYITIGETAIWTLPLTLANNSSAWTQTTIALNDWAGQTVTLTLGADNGNRAGVGNLFFDLVEFTENQDVGIAISVSPAAQVVVSGGSATFEITLENTGTVELRNVQLNAPDAPACNTNRNLLNPGQSATFSCSGDSYSEDTMVDFFVSATADGDIPVVDSAQSFVDVINPAVAITKSPDSQAISINGTAVFTIQVENTGDVPLTEISVADAPVPDCDSTADSLAVGELITYSCEANNILESFQNTATVSAIDPLGTTVSDSDTAFVDVENVELDTSISTTPGSLIEPGGDVRFDITVTNVGTGDLLLTELVSDPFGDILDNTNASIIATNCSGNQSISGNGGTYSCYFEAAVSAPAGSFTVLVTSTAVNDSEHNVSDTTSKTIPINTPPIFTTFLPLTLNNYVISEPNDICPDAYQLSLNHKYGFFADDRDDWYTFALPNAGNLTVELTNFVPLVGQITVWSGTSCNNPVFLGSNGNFELTKTVPLGLQPAGNYYIWIITDGPTNSVDPYNLEIIFE